MRNRLEIAMLRPRLRGAPARAFKRIAGGLIGLFAALALLSACRPEAFGRYRPDPEFVDLYVDLKLASTVPGQDPGRAGELRRVILAQHGMTPAEFHEHFMRLAGHPEAWRPFQERVVARIDAFQHEQTEGASHGQ